MQRIEHFIAKVLNGRSTPANLLSLCQQLTFICRPDHPTLLDVFSKFSVDDLRLTAQAERYIEAHICVCKSLGFSASLTMEVGVEALASYTAHVSRSQAKPFRLPHPHEATATRAMATRLQMVDEATPAQSEAWPQCLQSWLSELIQKNARVEPSIRAEVARVMNMVSY